MKFLSSRGHFVERVWREESERDGGRVGRGRRGRVGVVFVRLSGRMGMLLEQAGHCIVASLEMVRVFSAILKDDFADGATAKSTLMKGV